ncbi:MAG: FixH family protein [Myxococcales bacterium]|nr:FixH family protein [Myxococcales bacterium]
MKTPSLFSLGRFFAVLLLPLLTVWAMTSACPAPNTGDGGQEATPEGSGNVRTLATKEGTYRITYAPSPDPIPLNENFGLMITVEYADGREMTLPEDLTVKADGFMPEHNHGMLQAPTVQKESSAKYKIEGMKFHMPGKWQLKVEITTNNKTELAEFEIMMNN